VENEFAKLGVDAGSVILVYNKVDKLTDEEIKELKSYPYDTCYIGAKTGKNIVQLKQMIKEKLNNQY
jgi:50S ribosomal subunit-associated GTPase HflX